MTIIVRNYPCLTDNSKRSSFIWYLTTLPDALYASFGMEQYKSVGRAVIDAVLCDNYRHWLLGVVGLHADKSGGQALFDWYTKLGMEQVDASVKLPRLRGLLGMNDGRYFIYLPPKKLEAFAQLDDWR